MHVNACTYIHTSVCAHTHTHTHVHTWPHYQAWAHTHTHTQMYVGEGVVKVNMWAVVWCERGAGCVYNSLTLTLTLAMHLRLPYLQPLILQFYWQFHWLHGSGSWFKFNKGVESGETYSHKASLPIAVMEEIKPIFGNLSDSALLRRC